MKLMTSSPNLTNEINSLGIYTSEQLIDYLPYRYDIFNYTDETVLEDKQRVVILGKIVSNPKLVHTKSIDIISFHIISTGDKLYGVKIFNRSFYYKMLNFDDLFTIIATYNKEKNELNVINMKKGEIPPEERYQPVYHLTSFIQDSVYRKLVKRTLEELEANSKEILPHYIVEKYHLLNHFTALKMTHFPKSGEELSNGLRTLKFEECLSYCMKNKIIRDENKKLVKKNITEIDTEKINNFIKTLNFRLTGSQTQAVREIVLDMKKKSLMYRLLQGDVGTGKTLVAGIALYANYIRHRQGVLMAPTDSLARQHYDNITELFKNTKIRICLLTGSLSEKEKNALKNEIGLGRYDVIIGTHSVFSENTEYPSLGLAIIDEQHRFGVNQRNLLVNKGDEVDLLLMSATPIPRTLSLSIYGDLDVSSLTEYPGGKREIRTLVEKENSDKIQGLINYCLKNGKQVFIVCPKITVGSNSKAKSAEEIYEQFSKIYDKKIALLHGKIKNEEKSLILANFRSGETPILVATSIVELGIDVKTAMGMIVYSANNFGLASLHQLRGRVGRDSSKAYCILVTDQEDEEENSRLKFLETCSDGFKIAEEDLKRRGPGDFTGLEQSGFPSFSCLNIVNDFRMFEYARNETQFIVNNLNDKDNVRYYDIIMQDINKNEKVTSLFD